MEVDSEFEQLSIFVIKKSKQAAQKLRTKIEFGAAV
jgi:hypothetical protein